MKLIFISQDANVKEVFEHISLENVELLQGPDMLDESKYGESMTLLFLDFDNDREALETLNNSLVDRTDVIRLIVSETLSVEELKAHQASSESAHGYIRKPLSEEIVMGVVEDFEFSESLDLDAEDEFNEATGVALDGVDEASSVKMNLKLEEDESTSTEELEEGLDLSTQEGLSFNMPEETEDEEESLNLDGDDGISLSMEEDTAIDLDSEEAIEISFGSEESEEELKEEEEGGLEFADDAEEGGLELSDEAEEGGLELSDDAEEGGLELSDDAEEGGLELSDDAEEGGLELSDDAEEGGLELSDDAEEGGLELSDDTEEGGLELSDDTEEGGLEFSDDTEEGGLELSDNSEEGGLELSDNSEEGGLELSDDTEEGGLELSDDTEEGGLELSDDTEEGGIELSDDAEEDAIELSSDSGDETATETEGDLSLQEEESSSIDLDASSEDSSESMGDGTSEFKFNRPEASESEGLSFNMGDNSSEEPMLAGQDEATGEIDLEELNLSSDDNTNPTVVASSEDELNVQIPTEMTHEKPSLIDENTSSIETEAVEFTSTVKEDDIKRPSDEEIVKNYAEDEMLRLQATIRQLREEREDLLEKINGLESKDQLGQQESLGLKAEVDELKIEVSILKKRHQNELEELKYQLRLSDEKKQILEEKAKNYQKEFERLSQKVRIDFNKVKQREKELEGQLELLAMDSESQVKTRDMKILELKRKIDSLEFNMENVTIKEQKTREDKVKLEEKMTKMMKTLRGSIEVLENDVESELGSLEHKEEEL